MNEQRRADLIAGMSYKERRALPDTEGLALALAAVEDMEKAS